MTESLAFYVEMSRAATNPVVSSPILQPINTLPTNTNPYPHTPTPTPHPISAGAVDWLGLVQLIGSTYPYVPICTPLIQESWYLFICSCPPPGVFVFHEAVLTLPTHRGIGMVDSRNLKLRPTSPNLANSSNPWHLLGSITSIKVRQLTYTKLLAH